MKDEIDENDVDNLKTKTEYDIMINTRLIFFPAIFVSTLKNNGKKKKKTKPEIPYLILCMLNVYRFNTCHSLSVHY